MELTSEEPTTNNERVSLTMEDGAFRRSGSVTALHKKSTKRRSTVSWYSSWSALLSSFAGLFMYGYSIGSINAASVPIKSAITLHYQTRYNRTIDEGVLNSLWVCIGAAFPVGGSIGVLSLNVLSHRFNRVRLMIIGHTLVVAAGMPMALSEQIKSPEMLLFYRLIVGAVASCVGTGVTPMYITEIVEKTQRGIFGSTVTVFIGLAIFLSNVLGLPQVMGNSTLWPYFIALSSIPSLIFLLFAKFIGRSPRYMYQRYHDEEKVKKLLQKLRGREDVTEELDEMKLEIRKQTKIKKLSVWMLLMNSDLRAPLLSAIVVGLGQQMTGLNGVSFQMNDIFLNAGISPKMAPYCSIALTGVNVFLSFGSVYIIKLKGRKLLLQLGYGLQCIALVILATSIQLQSSIPAFKYMSFVGSFGYFIAFFIGPGSCTFVVMAEVFDQSSRTAGMTVSMFFTWVAFTVVVVVTPYMLMAIAGYAFIPFAVVALLALLYTHFYIPETRNKSFTEIQLRFSSRRRSSQRPAVSSSARLKFLEDDNLSKPNLS